MVQTPLMLAAMHGKISCLRKLLEVGANVCIKIPAFVQFGFPNSIFHIWIMWLMCAIYQVLMFDSLHGRTCLHYAAYYGHSDCLQAIVSAAHSSPVAVSWFVLLLLSEVIWSFFG